METNLEDGLGHLTRSRVLRAKDKTACRLVLHQDLITQDRIALGPRAVKHRVLRSRLMTETAAVVAVLVLNGSLFLSLLALQVYHLRTLRYFLHSLHRIGVKCQRRLR